MTNPGSQGEKEPISILIVDDHAIVSQGLRTYLDLQADMHVVGEAADGKQAIDKVKDLLPEIVLMDLVMPGMDGVQATREITAISPSTRVIVLTSFSEDDRALIPIRSGARGYW